MKNMVVFISGSGTNLQALLDWQEQGKLKAKIALVVSNKSDAFGIQRAQKSNIPTVVLDHKDYSSREEHEKAIEKYLQEYKIELIVLAGYMRLLTSDFVKKWIHKIINLHPSLLPSFTGVNAIEQAFKYGVKVSGVSTIFVDEGVDTGLIILQDIVKITSDDSLESLEEKIHNLEHILLPQTVNVVASGNFSIQGRKVIINSN